MAEGINIMFAADVGRWVAFAPNAVPPAAILKAMRWALDRCYLPRLRSAPAGPRREQMRARVDLLEWMWRQGVVVDQFHQATARAEVELSGNPAPASTKLISIGG